MCQSYINFYTIYIFSEPTDSISIKVGLYHHQGVYFQTCVRWLRHLTNMAAAIMKRIFWVQYSKKPNKATFSPPDEFYQICWSILRFAYIWRKYGNYTDFDSLIPLSQIKPNIDGMVLVLSLFNIVSNSLRPSKLPVITKNRKQLHYKQELFETWYLDLNIYSVYFRILSIFTDYANLALYSHKHILKTYFLVVPFQTVWQLCHLIW